MMTSSLSKTLFDILIVLIRKALKLYLHERVMLKLSFIGLWMRYLFSDMNPAKEIVIISCLMRGGVMWLYCSIPNKTFINYEQLA